jgi:hypothetical protein
VHARTLARKAVELLAHREGGVEGRYVHRVSERPVDYVGAAGLPFVEDDGCLRSSRLGILDLHHEVAGASLDERHVALRLGREVGGLTAAVRGALLDARRNDDVISGHDLPPYVPRSGVLHKSVVRVVHVGAGGWSEALEGWGTGLLKERELEGLFGDDETRAAQLVGHVRSRRVVARRAGRPRAVVRVGDILEFALVLHDAFDAHGIS